MARRYKLVWMASHIDEDTGKPFNPPVWVQYGGYNLMSETASGLSAMIADAICRGSTFKPFGKVYPPHHPKAGKLVKVPPYKIVSNLVDWSSDKEILLRNEMRRQQFAQKDEEAQQKGWERPEPGRHRPR